MLQPSTGGSSVLEALGLPPHSAAAYRTAVSRLSWCAAELETTIAVSDGMAAQEARSVVDGLVELRLLRPGSDGGGRLYVTPPAVALGARLSDARTALAEQEHEIDAAARVLAELQESYEGARAADLELAIERITGLDEIHARLEHLAAEVRSEVLSFLPQGAQNPQSMAASRPLNEANLRRGVSMRTVYLHAAARDAATRTEMKGIVEMGGEVRTVATLPLRLIIADRAVAVIPADPENIQAGALLVRSHGVLTALLALFESVWLGAQPFLERHRGEGIGVSDTEREVLRLLTTGATDEAVAHHLAVSVRTVRRITSALATRFGARSRFELALHLGQVGWGPDRVGDLPGHKPL